MLLDGPYGAFRRPKSDAPQVWVAGGIGITPFLTWMGAGRVAGPEDLLWAVRDPALAPHLDEVLAAVAADPKLTLHVCVSAAGQRLDAARVTAVLGGAMATAQVFCCGPAGLCRAAEAGLVAHGLPRATFHAEAFEIRTGTGSTRLVEHLVKCAITRLRPRSDKV